MRPRDRADGSSGGVDPVDGTVDGSYLARLGILLPTPDDEPAQVESHDSWASRLTQARHFTTQHMKVLSALALVAVIVATWMVMRAQTVPLDEPVQTPTWIEPTPTPTPQWQVHVLGAVIQPGVVSVPPGARVADAIEAAGGLSAQADPGELNLAAVLIDGSQIVIGTIHSPAGEVRQGSGGTGGASTAMGGGGPPAGDGTINLNQATMSQLDTLPGVGPVTAQAILAWRDESGPFTSVAQLQEVDGIGPKTYAQIEPHVSV